MADQQQFDVMLINANIDNLTRRVDALSSEVDSLVLTVNSQGQSQALFEYKHDQAKRVSDKLEQIVDRISEKGEQELRRTIEMLDRREARLADSIQSHKELVLRDVGLQHQTFTQKLETLTAAVENLRLSQDTDRKDIGVVQRWMWILMGTLAALAFLGDKLFSLITG